MGNPERPNGQHAIADPLTLPHQHISSGSIHRRQQSPKQNVSSGLQFQFAMTVGGVARALNKNGCTPRQFAPLCNSPALSRIDGKGVSSSSLLTRHPVTARCSRNLEPPREIPKGRTGNMQSLTRSLLLINTSASASGGQYWDVLILVSVSVLTSA